MECDCYEEDKCTNVVNQDVVQIERTVFLLYFRLLILSSLGVRSRTICADLKSKSTSLPVSFSEANLNHTL